MYTRSGGAWTQLGSKLVGTGAIGNAREGYSVALSGDGNTAVLGGPYDNSGCCYAFVGAAWVFAATAPPGPVTVFSPAQGATGVSLTPALIWGSVTGVTSYDVYFGTSLAPPFVANTTGTSYSPAALNPNTTYYWYLVSINAGGSTPSAIWSFHHRRTLRIRRSSLGRSAWQSEFITCNSRSGNIFGYYNYQYFPILYHYDLGFEYFLDANDGENGAYLYDFASGHWFYTSPSFRSPSFTTSR